MFRKPAIWRTMSLLILMALPMVQLNAQQQFAGSNDYRATSGGQRMLVVDNDQSASVQPGYYTVVGNVDRSGVYISDATTLSVSTLIKAAGGLPDNSAVPMRILSGNRPPVQLFVGADATDVVRQNEILVVGGTPPASQTGETRQLVPVVCLGLLPERPVVLPLIPEIANVPALVQNLMQSSEIIPGIRRIDPAGGNGGSALQRGSVLIFDHATIDELRLRSARELPPAVSLKVALEATTPLTQAENPHLQRQFIEPPATSANDVPPGFVVRNMSTLPDLAAGQIYESGLPSGPIIAPALPELPGRVGSDSDLFSQTAQLPSPLPVVIPSVPVAAVTIERPIIEVEPIAAAPVLPTPAAPVMEPVQPPSRVVQTSSELTAIASASAPTPTEWEPEPTPADPVPSVTESAALMPTAPAPPRESPVVTSPRSFDSRDNATSGSEIVAPQSSSKSGLWPIFLTVGVLTLFCLGGCIVWSRYDQLIFPHSHEQSIAETESLTVAVPAPAERSHPVRSRLTEVIDQAIPVIEEPVSLPVQVPLHGEAVGHRKLILHAAHETVPAPKFAARRATTERPAAIAGKHSERELRTQLRSALTTADQRFERDNLSAVELDFTSQFDVVQPEPLQGKSGSGSSEGALERALRSLDRENRT